METLDTIKFIDASKFDWKTYHERCKTYLKQEIKNISKIFILQNGDGLDNGVGQYIGEAVGWTDDWNFACKWAQENKGYYQPLDKIIT